MVAVLYRWRVIVRQRWVSIAGLTLIVAAIVGVVLAFAAGARRTGTAADRYTSARGGALDGLIYQSNGPPLTHAVAALPGAATVRAASFVFGGLTNPGSTDWIDASVFTGSYEATTAALVAGRDTDPTKPGEFVASAEFFKSAHARIGQHFQLRTLSQQQADASGFNVPDPDGPTVDGVLVGEIDGPSALDDPTPIVVFSPALSSVGDVGIRVTLMSVGFADGTDLDGFRKQLDTLPRHDLLSLQRAVIVSDSTRHALEAQSLGLWALAGVAGVAAVAALGQLLTRSVRVSEAERARLSALGYSHNQMITEALVRTAVPLIGGVAIGVTLAIATSGAFPVGFARRVEPHAGVRVEGLVLAAGALVFVVAVSAWVVNPMLFKRARRFRRERPAAAVEALATRTHSLPASTGVRFAFTRGEGDRGSVRTVIIGLALTVAALVGALTFGASLRRLIDQPRRYGAAYDLLVGGNGADELPASLRETLQSDDTIAGLVLYTESQARHGNDTLRLVGMDRVKGNAGPPVLEGRLPSAEDEIALGRLAARALHVGIGDTVALAGGSGTVTFRVTGLAVIPSIGLNEGVGQDGVVTMDALSRLDQSARVTDAALSLDPNAPQGTMRRLLLAGGLITSADQAQPSVTRPAAITNVARLRPIPFILAAVLGTLSLLTLCQAMVLSVRNRRRDAAILRSIGADRRLVSRAVHWQATVFAALPLIVGVPLGIIAGRAVFRVFADSMGTLNDASLPLLLIALAVLGAAVVANIVAAIAARPSRHGSPILALRVE